MQRDQRSNFEGEGVGGGDGGVVVVGGGGVIKKGVREENICPMLY